MLYLFTIDVPTSIRPPKPLAILSRVDLRPGINNSRPNLDTSSGSTAESTAAGTDNTTVNTAASTADYTAASIAEGKPPIELFRSIFGGDSDASDSSDTEQEAKQEEKEIDLSSAVVSEPAETAHATNYTLNDVTRKDNGSERTLDREGDIPNMDLASNAEVARDNDDNRCIKRKTSHSRHKKDDSTREFYSEYL